MEADFSGACLAESTLFRTLLTHSNLQDADLSKANLHKADLFDANLIGADLSHAVLEDCYINSGTKLSNVRGLSTATFTHLFVSEKRIDRAIFMSYVENLNS